jgi:hypothetical protein
VVAIQTVFVNVLAVTPNEQENTEVTTKGIRLQEKRKQPQEKSPTSEEKIKLTKSNTNVEKKTTQTNMSEIIPNNMIQSYAWSTCLSFVSSGASCIFARFNPSVFN